MNPYVVHCKRDAHDVYIGRPGKWGNPFTIGKDGNRAEVIAQHRAWLLTQPQLLADIPTLYHKTLGCWCAPQECHGDTLAEWANRIHAVIVTGSREWTDANAIRNALVELRTEWDGPFYVIAGAARGADSIAAQCAREIGLWLREFPADWNQYGKQAGMVRNRQMLDKLLTAEQKRVLAFPLGESKGTRNMIAIARQAGVLVDVRN
jgi:hypothetical protein